MKIQVIEQDNCGWCIRLHPHIEKLATDLSTEIEYFNLSRNPEEQYAERWVIQTTPTVCIMDDEWEVEQARFTIGPDGIAGIIKGVREYFNE